MWKVIIAVAICLPVAGALAQSNEPGTKHPEAPSNAGMAQPAGTADKPKEYQPANPAPDTRSAPTSSSTGSGSDNGGRPEEQPKK